MSEVRRHVLTWLAPEFLRSSGMIQLFREAEIFLAPEDDLDEYIRSAEAAGGFALTGRLVDIHHGAGIWICPVNVPGLELMVPWQFVKTVVTAESPTSSKIFGLMTDLAQASGVNKKEELRNNGRNT